MHNTIDRQHMIEELSKTMSNINLNHLYLVLDTHQANTTVHIFDSVASRKKFLREVIRQMWSELYDDQPPAYINDQTIDNFLYSQNRYHCSESITAHSALALASLSTKIKQRI